MITANDIAIGGNVINLEGNFNSAAVTNCEPNYNDLIDRCKTERKCLEILYNSLKKGVFAIAFSIVSDFQLAEDCVAETFVRLVGIKRFSAKDGDGKGFIYRIARNVAMEHYRKFKKNRDDIDSVVQGYGETEKTVEDSIYINGLLKSLNDKQRQVVIMRCYNEMSFKEIGAVLKIPATTVKSRYKKAIEILQGKAGV